MKGIIFKQDNYYVTNEGTRSKQNYHVWVPGVTHSKCDSAYLEMELAITRCKYLANNNIKLDYEKNNLSLQSMSRDYS